MNKTAMCTLNLFDVIRITRHLHVKLKSCSVLVQSLHTWLFFFVDHRLEIRDDEWGVFCWRPYTSCVDLKNVVSGKGGVLKAFFVCFVFSHQHIFHRSPYEPPSRSNWTLWVQLLLERGRPYQYFSHLLQIRGFYMGLAARKPVFGVSVKAIQTRLLSYRDYLENWNFTRSKFTYGSF